MHHKANFYTSHRGGRDSEPYGMSQIMENPLLSEAACLKERPWPMVGFPHLACFSGWWARTTPLKNMTSSIGMIIETQYVHGKIQKMATSYHQPDMIVAREGEPHDQLTGIAPLLGPSLREVFVVELSGRSQSRSIRHLAVGPNGLFSIWSAKSLRSHGLIWTIYLLKMMMA